MDPEPVGPARSTAHASGALSLPALTAPFARPALAYACRRLTCARRAGPAPTRLTDNFRHFQVTSVVGTDRNRHRSGDTGGAETGRSTPLHRQYRGFSGRSERDGRATVEWHPACYIEWHEDSGRRGERLPLVQATAGRSEETGHHEDSQQQGLHAHRTAHRRRHHRHHRRHRHPGPAPRPHVGQRGLGHRLDARHQQRPGDLRGQLRRRRLRAYAGRPAWLAGGAGTQRFISQDLDRPTWRPLLSAPDQERLHGRRSDARQRRRTPATLRTTATPPATRDRATTRTPCRRRRLHGSARPSAPTSAARCSRTRRGAAIAGAASRSAALGRARSSSSALVAGLAKAGLRRPSVVASAWVSCASATPGTVSAVGRHGCCFDQLRRHDRTMSMAHATGFTLIELLIVVTLIGVLAALAAPFLIAAKPSANEASAVQSLRALCSAQATFCHRLRQGLLHAVADHLVSERFASPDLDITPKSGYSFALAGGARRHAWSGSTAPARRRSSGYYFRAEPLAVNTGAADSPPTRAARSGGTPRAWHRPSRSRRRAPSPRSIEQEASRPAVDRRHAATRGAGPHARIGTVPCLRAPTLLHSFASCSAWPPRLPPPSFTSSSPRRRGTRASATSTRRSAARRPTRASTAGCSALRFPSWVPATSPHCWP